jgi:Uncharacterized conserved protein
MEEDRVMPKLKATTIPEYISASPKEAQKHLRDIYAILKSVAPDAREAIKWGNPMFEEKRILFAFAAYRTHLNFMPTPSALKPFKKDLAKYKTGKGSIQLPYDERLPKALIRRIAMFRSKELREKDVRWM